MLVGRLILLLMLAVPAIGQWSTVNYTNMPRYWDTNIMAELDAALDERASVINTKWAFVRSKGTWTTGGVSVVTVTNDYGRYYSTSFLSAFDSSLASLFSTIPLFVATAPSSPFAYSNEWWESHRLTLSNLVLDTGGIWTNGGPAIILYSGYSGHVTNGQYLVGTNLYGAFPSASQPSYYSRTNIAVRRAMLDRMTQSLDVVTWELKTNWYWQVDFTPDMGKSWSNMFLDEWAEIEVMYATDEYSQTSIVYDAEAEWSQIWSVGTDGDTSYNLDKLNLSPAYRSTTSNAFYSSQSFLQTNAFWLNYRIPGRDSHTNNYPIYVTFNGAFVWPGPWDGVFDFSGGAPTDENPTNLYSTYSTDLAWDTNISAWVGVTKYTEIDDSILPDGTFYGPSVNTNSWGNTDIANESVSSQFYSGKYRTATFIQWDFDYK